MRQAQFGQPIALRVGEHELFGGVGEDANAVDALIDHAIEHPPLPIEIDLTRFGEGSGRNRQHAAKGRLRLAGRVEVDSSW